MLRRVRTALFVLLAAGLGAVLGRVAFQARERLEAGESPTDIDFTRVTLRVQDVIPGLVAAFRVKDAPWSWFHVPSWLAAFSVNLGVGAVGGDITRLREQAERAAFGAVGLDAREFGMGGDWDDEDEDLPPAPGANGSGYESWNVPPTSSPSPSSPPPSSAPFEAP